jgi:hypothetical protein
MVVADRSAPHDVVVDGVLFERPVAAVVLGRRRVDVRVTAAGGGDIRQLVRSIEKIITDFPADAKVVPGHGELATMQDLKNYLAMLKETIGIVDAGIKGGKTLDQLQKEKVLAKYDALGSGGAQTTEQYLTMLFNLLSTDKK